MSISFKCSLCGRQFDVPDHLEGKQARCQTCGQVVTIVREAILVYDPASQAAGSPVSVATTPQNYPQIPYPTGEALPPPNLQAGRRRPHPGVVTAVAAAAVAVLIGLVAILAVTLASRGDQDRDHRPSQPDRRVGTDTPPPIRSNPGPPSRENSLPGGPAPSRNPPAASDAPPKDRWSLAPDPMPPQSGQFQARAVDLGEAKDRPILIARDAPRAIVTQVDRGGLKVPAHVTVFDLVSARAIATAEIPNGSRVVAVSHDGNSMVVAPPVSGSPRNVFNVWNLNGNTAQPGPTVPLAGDDSGSVKRAWYVTADQLLVQPDSGKTRLYDLRTQQPRYTLDVESSTWPAVSPGGKWLVTCDRERIVRFYDSATGKVVCTLGPVGEAFGLFGGASFSPDGRRFLLVLTVGGMCRRAFCWDMESGQRIAQLEIPYEQIGQRDEVPVWWCAKEYLVIGSHLCHLGMGLCYRRYANRPLGYLAQGRLWIDVQDCGHSCLVPAEIPLPNDRVTIQKDIQNFRPLLQRGDALRVEIRGADRAPRAAFPGELSSRVRQRLEKVGYRPTSQAPFCLQVSITEHEEGPAAEYEWWGGNANRQAFTVPNRILCLTLELLDSRGAVKWKDDDNFRLPGRGFPFSVNKGDPATQLLNERWDSLISSMESYDFPSVLYDQDNVDSVDVTQINLAALTAQTDHEPSVESLLSSWTYQQDMALSPAREFVNKRLKLSEGRLFDARFAGPEAGQVAVLMSLSSGDGQISTSRRVERVDMANSQVLGSFEVAADAQLLDFRPDGRVIAVKVPNTSNSRPDRLEIWSCSPEGDKRFMEWAVYEDHFSTRLAWGLFVGTNRLLTHGQYSRTLELWQLPDRQKLRSIEWKSEAYPPLSAQRKYVAVPRKDAVEILDTTDLTVAGRLPLTPGSPERLDGGAFDRNGTRLAIVLDDFIYIWNLENRQLVGRFPAKETAPGHRWLDQRYYYAGGHLIDLEEEATVWKYNHEHCLADSPDGRFWYAAVGPENRPYLCTTELPSRQVLSILEKALVAGVVLQPGFTVSVQTKTEGNPRSEFCQAITSAVKDELARRGFQVVHGAALTMQITIKDELQDRSRQVVSHVESGLTRHHLSVSLDLISSHNASWHEFMVDIVDYKASGELADGEQPPSEAFGSWIRSKIIPKKIFKWSPYDTAGESELTFDGEEIKRGFSGR